MLEAANDELRQRGVGPISRWDGGVDYLQVLEIHFTVPLLAVHAQLQSASQVYGAGAVARLTEVFKPQLVMHLAGVNIQSQRVGEVIAIQQIDDATPLFSFVVVRQVTGDQTTFACIAQITKFIVELEAATGIYGGRDGV